MRMMVARRALRLAGAAIGGGAGLAFAGAAGAQDAPFSTAPGEPGPAPAISGAADPREARIGQSEREIHELAAEVAGLKASLSEGVSPIRREQPPQAAQASRRQVGLTNARPRITASDGAFAFALRSLVQFDAADYHVDQASPAGQFVSGSDFRRARLGVDARAYRDWNVSIWGDFAGSGGASMSLNQAFVEYAGFRPFRSTGPIRIRVGAWATPAGLEDATPNTEMLFLERPAVAETVRGLDAGDARESAGVFATGARWYVSGVLTGRVAGGPASPAHGQQAGFLTRAAFNPLHGEDYDVHLGGSIQGVITPAAETLTLTQQPELRVDPNGTRLVGAGPIDANGIGIYGAEAGASFRNFYAAGEYYRLDVRRRALSSGAASPFNPSFSGWYLQCAWTLTGERHVWSSANGGFRGIFEPRHDFVPAAGSWGAWEIAARYSVLDLNAAAGASGQAAPAGGVRGGVQKIASLGLDWYPNSVLRFVFEYQNGEVDRLSSAGADLGARFDAISVRSQFAF